MARRVTELRSERSTDEIEALPRREPLTVRVPLTLDTWVLAEAMPPGTEVVAFSADGGSFTGRIASVNEQRRTVDVELS